MFWDFSWRFLLCATSPFSVRMERWWAGTWTLTLWSRRRDFSLNDSDEWLWLKKYTSIGGPFTFYWCFWTLCFFLGKCPFWSYTLITPLLGFLNNLLLKNTRCPENHWTWCLTRVKLPPMNMSERCLHALRRGEFSGPSSGGLGAVPKQLGRSHPGLLGSEAAKGGRSWGLLPSSGAFCFFPFRQWRAKLLIADCCGSTRRQCVVCNTVPRFVNISKLQTFLLCVQSFK